MKIPVTLEMHGQPGNQFRFLTTPCPFNNEWVEERKVGSMVCGRCEYNKGSTPDVVYCRRGDKGRHAKPCGVLSPQRKEMP